MTYLPVEAIVCCSFDVVIATINPVDAFGLYVQCDTSWPAQFIPYDPITVCAIHERPLQAWLSIQCLPVREEHVAVKEGKTFNPIGSLHEDRNIHVKPGITRHVFT